MVNKVKEAPKKMLMSQIVENKPRSWKEIAYVSIYIVLNKNLIRLLISFSNYVILKPSNQNKKPVNKLSNAVDILSKTVARLATHVGGSYNHNS